MRNCLNVFVSLLVITSLSGCDLFNIAAFRSQIRNAPPAYFLDENGAYVELRFSEPVLLEKSLLGLGIPVEREAPDVFLAKYRIQINECPELEYDVYLVFQQSRLHHIRMPALLPELFGEKNIKGLFRFAGGGRVSSEDFDDITPERVEMVLKKHHERSAKFGLNLNITLRPERSSQKKISIRLSRPNEASVFSKIVFEY